LLHLLALLAAIERIPDDFSRVIERRDAGSRDEARRWSPQTLNDEVGSESTPTILLTPGIPEISSDRVQPRPQRNFTDKMSDLNALIVGFHLPKFQIDRILEGVPNDHDFHRS
jgi:hypothetical protein